MLQQHPITPPPELVEQWYEAINNSSTSWKQALATKAACWGADQELEACCALIGSAHVRDRVRAVRRPKPPSLAEQALALVSAIERSDEPKWDFTVIRRAVERLQELESNG